jgi:hypothetical protein
LQQSDGINATIEAIKKPNFGENIQADRRRIQSIKTMLKRKELENLIDDFSQAIKLHYR